MPLQLSRQELNRHVETLLVLMFAVSISLWKPGIYISCGSILLYALLRSLFDTPYRQQLLSGWIAKTTISLFLFGVLASWFYPGLSADIALYARKGMFLLMAAPLLLMFEDVRNRQFAITGLCLGLWVASTMHLLMTDHLLHPDLRFLPATWDVGVWGLSSGLMVSFFTPFVLEKQSGKQRLLCAISLCIALGILLLTAARGPWIGTLASVCLYLLLMQRKVFGWILIALLVAYWPAKQLAPMSIQAIEARATSILDVNNESNKIRLSLWQLASSHFQEKHDQAPLSFWFGSGMDHHVQELRGHFVTTTSLTDEQKTYLSERDYPSNDLHNMYLDTTAKMGILWAVFSFSFLIAFGVHSARLSHPGNHLPLAGVLVLTNFMVVGFFYDIMLHFGTFFLIFFIALAAQSKPAEAPHFTWSSQS